MYIQSKFRFWYGYILNIIKKIKYCPILFCFSYDYQVLQDQNN